MTAYTEGPVFREFAVRLPLPAKDLVDALVPKGFLAGVPLGWVAGFMSGAGGAAAPPRAGALDDVLLLAVTEKRTKAEIDAFVDAVAEVIGHG